MRNTYLIVAIAILLSSCASTRRVSYFQDLRSGDPGQYVSVPLEIKVRPDDKISILVNSRDPQLADLFNLPIITRQVGNTNNYNGTYRSQQGLSGYTINAEGCIDFPVLGRIPVDGMTRQEIAAHIKKELISKNLIKDPVVTVEFMNLAFSVMGEVKSPGKYSIDKDKVTLLDALSMAGDLTIFGKRERVLVLREVEGKQQTYEVNLCSGSELYKSPAYYLQQNDIVYVEPNNYRAREATINGNNWRSTSFWISLGSLLTTISVLIFK